MVLRCLYPRFLLILCVLAMPGAPCGAHPLPVTHHTLHNAYPRYYDAAVSYAQVSCTSPVIRLANQTLKQTVRKDFLEFTRGNGPHRYSLPPPVLHSLDGGTHVTLATPSLVSADIRQSAYDIDGAAHETVWNTTVNIGTLAERAAPLTLQDLFRKNIDGAALAARIVSWELTHRRSSGYDGDLASHGMRAIADVLPDRFVITPTGLLFIFNPYEIGAFAEGSLSVSVSFGELRKALDPNGPLKPLLHTLRPTYTFHHRGGKTHG